MKVSTIFLLRHALGYLRRTSVRQNHPRDTRAVTLRHSTTELAKTNAELAREIAERKRVEQELRQAEAKYRSIFENAVEGIFQTTPDGHYISSTVFTG